MEVVTNSPTEAPPALPARREKGQIGMPASTCCMPCFPPLGAAAERMKQKVLNMFGRKPRNDVIALKILHGKLKEKGTAVVAAASSTPEARIACQQQIVATRVPDGHTVEGMNYYVLTKDDKALLASSGLAGAGYSDGYLIITHDREMIPAYSLPGPDYHEAQRFHECGRHCLNIMNEGRNLASQFSFHQYMVDRISNGTGMIEQPFFAENAFAKEFKANFLASHPSLAPGSSEANTALCNAVRANPDMLSEAAAYAVNGTSLVTVAEFHNDRIKRGDIVAERLYVGTADVQMLLHDPNDTEQKQHALHCLTNARSIALDFTRQVKTGEGTIQEAHSMVIKRANDGAFRCFDSLTNSRPRVVKDGQNGLAATEAALKAYQATSPNTKMGGQPFEYMVFESALPPALADRLRREGGALIY